MPRRRLTTVCLLAALAAGCGGAAVGGHAGTTAAARSGAVAVSSAGAHDWPMFGRNPARQSSLNASIGITAATAPRLRRQQVNLPGTVDQAPIFLHSVQAAG